jgi:hypothetical protein
MEVIECFDDKPSRDSDFKRMVADPEVAQASMSLNRSLLLMGRFGFCYTPTMRILAVSLMVAMVSVLALSAQQIGVLIDPPAGTHAVLQANGDGVQIYSCSSVRDGFKWVLSGPDAKLLDATGKVIGSHFAGPTWKLLDGSQVRGELVASQPAPEANSVAWLLLRAKAGTATGTLANVAFIRRTETHGGVAVASQCQSSQDAGKTVQIPYTATYTFYAEK